MAEQVMSMPESEALSSGTLSIQRTCPKCEEEKLRRQPIEKEEEEKLQRQPIKEEEEEKVQKKATSGCISKSNSNLESHIRFLKGGGQQLSENDRTFFEPRFGYDFSKVRVHTDSKAAESARAVNALAFTVGNNVVFGDRLYVSWRTDSQKLLAHELVHTIQQNGDLTKIR